MATTENKPRSQFVAFDEYVDVQLDKTRSTIRSTDVLTAIVGASTVLLGYLFLFVLADHWIGTEFLPANVRLVLGSTVVLGSAGWLVWSVLLPARRRISTLFVAKELESNEPALRSNLLNLVDLKHADRDISTDVLNSIEKRAAVGLSRADIDSAVDRRLLMKVSYLLLGIVALACVYLLFQSKPVGASLMRAFGSTAAIPTRVRIQTVQVRVAPGDDPAAIVAAKDNPQVAARFQPLVTAVVSGPLDPQEVVTLYYSTADERFVDQPLVMEPTTDSLGTLHSREYSVKLIGDNGLGLLQNIIFHIAAGDAKTESYTIEVLTGASATADSVSFTYPEYMKLEPETRDGGQVNSWEGTTVTVHARASSPVRSARIVFSDDEDTTKRSEEIPMFVRDGTQLSASWKLKFRSNDQDDYPHFYRIICRDQQGTSALDPTLYNITVRPDARPSVEILSPAKDTTHPANATVPLLVKAKDPDFQLRYLKIRIKKNGRVLPQHVSILDTQRPSFGPESVDLKLAPYRLSTGEKITYWIEAVDNKLPTGNVTNSPEFKITITDPVSPEQAQKRHDAEQQVQQAQADRNRDDNASDNPMAGDNPQDSASTPDASKDGQGNQPGEDPDVKPGTDPASKPTTGSEPQSTPGSKPTPRGDQPNQEKPAPNERKPGEDKRSSKGDTPGKKGTDPDRSTPDRSGNEARDAESSKPGQTQRNKNDQPRTGREKEGSPNEPLQTDGSDDDRALKRIRDRLKRASDQSPSEDSTDPDNPNSDQANKPPSRTKDDPTRPGKDPSDSKSDEPKTGKGRGKNAPPSTDNKPRSQKTKENTKKSTTDKKGNGRKSSNDKGSPPKKTNDPAASPRKDPTDSGGKPDGKPGNGKPDRPKNETGKPKPGQDGKPADGNSGKQGRKKGSSKSKPGRSGKKGAGKKKGDTPDADQEGDSSGSKPKSSGKAAGSKPTQKGGKPGKGSAGKKSAQGSGGDAPKAGRQSPSDSEPQDQKAGSGTGPDKKGATPEPVNEAFTREAANLVLKRVENELQRGDVDPALLKELGWTEKDMQKFADRLKHHLNAPTDDNSPQSRARRRQFEELLKSVNVPSRGTRRTGRARQTRKTDAINASDQAVPLQFREAVKLYRRNLTRRKKPSTKRP